ncbi:MAG: hypothetical protein GXO48_05035 [Chlorobi bacterium]|nr:hypothetical protein [Chlorobiota bacterium]
MRDGKGFIVAFVFIYLFQHTSSAQNVGIGAPVPKAKLHIAVPTSYSDSVFLVTSGSSVFVIVTSSGKVGIGVANPSAPLTVSKHIYQVNTGKSLFIGEFAGEKDDLSNRENTAVGYSALRNNTTAYQNVAIGAFALSKANNSRWNVAIGYLTMDSFGGSMHSNVAIGYKAGHKITSFGNVAIGANAMSNVVANYADNNIAIGKNALKGYNKGAYGSENVAIGNNAMSNCRGCRYNVAIGSYAYRNDTAVGGLSSTGESNVAIGYYAMSIIQNATGNIAIGNSAMYGRVNSNDIYWNIAIGTDAMKNNFSGDRNVAIGTNALESDSIGDNNVAIGMYSLWRVKTGSFNTAVGYGSGSTVTTGSYNTFVGYNTDVSGASVQNCVAIGGNGNLPINSSNTIRIGNSSIVSIGGQVNWTTVSDGRFKSNIKEDVPGLNFILKLRPVTYNIGIKHQNQILGIKQTEENNSANYIETIKFSGFIAQEVDSIAKLIGYDFSGVDKSQLRGDGTGYYGLRYADFIPAIVKAIQELHTEIDSLRRENQWLKKQLNDIMTNQSINSK